MKLFCLEIQHLSPNAVVRLGAFEWAFRAEGAEPSARAFAHTHQVGIRNKYFTYAGVKMEVCYGNVYFNPRPGVAVPGHAYKDRMETAWVTKWFYHTVPADSGLSSACNPPALVSQPVILMDNTLRTRIRLLVSVAARLAIRDLVEEFIVAEIWPLCASWDFLVEPKGSEAIFWNGEDSFF